MTPRVSVLMPVWRPHPRHFPVAVGSVLGQTFADFELVIVEDPSETSATDMLKGVNDHRIRLVTNPLRTGLLAQRNRTLAEARAEWVALLDADDAMEPNRLDVQWAAHEANRALDVIGSALTIIDGDGKTIGTRKYPETQAEILRAFPRFNPVAQPAALVRKQAMLDACGYTFEFPAEDYDLWSRLAKAGATFANLPLPLTRYRIGGATKSKKLRRTIHLTRAVKRAHWWSAMTTRDRLRYHSEGMLTLLPAGLVAALFRRLTYSISKS